jgi:uncharacterized protein
LPMSGVRETGETMTESSEPSSVLRVAAVGDIHVKEDQVGPLRELFAEASRHADALVLAGDLTDHGRVREAEILAEELRFCNVPVIGVLGNHDYETGHADDIKDILRKAGMHLLDGDTFELNGVGFVGVKGFAGGFGRRMLGAFGEPAIKAFVGESVNEAMLLENALHTLTTERIVVVLHYSPVSGTLEGEPEEIWPFLGSSRLAETIDRFNVSFVVHGHAHHGTYKSQTLTGIPVYNVALPMEKPSGKPFGLITI